MSLIYNPSPIFMNPRNNTIDLGNVFNLEFVFNGYICKKVLYHFYDGSTLIGNGTSLQTIFTDSNSKYNNDIITKEVPIGHFDNIQYTNIGWRCYVFGEYKSMTVDSLNQCTIPNHGYTTGDLVNITVSKTINEIPYIAYVYAISDSLVKFFDTREKALSNVGTPLLKSLLDGKQSCPMAYSVVSSFTTVFANTFVLDKITITMPICTFIPHFTNTSVYLPRIYKWKAFLYSSNNHKLIEASEEFFNGLVKYKFENALFSGNSYGIRFVAYDENDYEYDTGIIDMDVLYDTPSIGFNPIVVNNCESSSIGVEWTGAININGNITGDYEYIHNFYQQDNNAVLINANEKLFYNVDIPLNSPPIFMFSPYNNSFDGDIMRLDNELTGDYAIVSYSQNDKIFKYNVNGVVTNVDVPIIDESTNDIEGINVNFTNSKSHDEYKNFKIKGNTTQITKTNIKPSFNLNGYIPLVGTKIILNDVEKILYSCGEYKDYIKDDILYKETADFFFDSTFQSFSLVQNNEEYTTFSCFNENLPSIEIEVGDNIWCSYLPSVGVATYDNEAIWYNNKKQIFLTIANKNLVNSEIPTVSDLLNKIGEFWTNNKKFHLLIPQMQEFNYAYGVRTYQSSSNPVLTRIGLAVGKIANVGYRDTSSVVVNDFDNIYPWSDMKICNVLNGEVVSFYGDSTFKIDGSNGDVMVQIPKHYYKKELVMYGNDIQINEWICKDPHPEDGFELNPKFKVDGIGNELNYFYFSTYEGIIGSNPSSTTDPISLMSMSSQGYIFNERNNYGLLSIGKSLTEFRDKARVKCSKYGCQDIASYSMLKSLFTIEFATRNSQNIFNGVNFLQTYQFSVVYDSVKNKLAFDASSIDIYSIVGNGVYFHYDQFPSNVISLGFVTNILQTGGQSYQVITSKSLNSVFPEGVTRGYIETGFVCSAGLTSLKGKLQYPSSSSSNHNKDSNISSFVYRGIENLYGNIYKMNDGVITQNNEMYISKQPSLYNSDTLNSSYQKLNFNISTETESYIKIIDIDKSISYIEFPIVSSGASETSYYCDEYTYQEGTNIVASGGYIFGSGRNGINCVKIMNSANNEGWNGYHGTRLIMESSI